MNANVMRAPLIKSAVVLLVFVLLAYLTSSSPEGSVLNSLGLIIIGAFRFVQWLVAMAIGISVCIAFLIGIFLFAASLVDQQAAADMYARARSGIVELFRPAFAAISSLRCKDGTCGSQPVQAAVDGDQLKDELAAMLSGQVKQIADHQQTLLDQLATLTSKIQAMEQKSAEFAVAGQVEAVAGEIAASEKMLGEIRESLSGLEGKINSTMQQVQSLSPEKVLGDLPTRLEKLEQQEGAFDPQPLTESVQQLQKELEEIKRKSSTASRARKKA